LTTDAQLKTIAEQFAQDKKAFHTAFGTAFVKLSELGYDGESLTHVEHFLDDHPQRWLYDKFYWEKSDLIIMGILTENYVLDH